MKRLESRLPILLSFIDFPPSNLSGGPIYLKQLFADYPMDKFMVLTSSNYAKQSPRQDRLKCQHIIFPTTNNTGSWGLGRIKELFNYILIPFLTLFGVWIIMKKRIQVIFTIAHGHFFLAATLTSFIAKVPLVIKIDDDWVSGISRLFILKKFYEYIFYCIFKHSQHIYAISSQMQEMLKTKYGINSTLQFPAVEGFPEFKEKLQEKFMDDGILHIIYAGNLVGTVLDSLDLLIRLLFNCQKYALPQWELQIYSHISQEDTTRQGWQDKRIKIKGWISQDELKFVLCSADILFLPLSFSPRQRILVSTLFPNKTAVYLASGRPILIFAPHYSTLSDYAKRHGFAEIVDEPTAQALARGIKNIVNSQEYRQQLYKNARVTFELNHNIIKQREDFKNTISYRAKINENIIHLR